MAGRIKGITVEIGGDTTGLEKALKSVNTTIRNTQSQLKDVNRLLKLDPSNTELLSQKQRALKDAIGATTDKLETLKQAQAQAKQQLENGDSDRTSMTPCSVRLLKPSRNSAACRKRQPPPVWRLPRLTKPGRKLSPSAIPSPMPVRRSCPPLWQLPVSVLPP